MKRFMRSAFFYSCTNVFVICRCSNLNGHLALSSNRTLCWHHFWWTSVLVKMFVNFATLLDCNRKNCPGPLVLKKLEYKRFLNFLKSNGLPNFYLLNTGPTNAENAASPTKILPASSVTNKHMPRPDQPYQPQLMASPQLHRRWQMAQMMAAAEMRRLSPTTPQPVRWTSQSHLVCQVV